MTSTFLPELSTSSSKVVATTILTGAELSSGTGSLFLWTLGLPSTTVWNHVRRVASDTSVSSGQAKRGGSGLSVLDIYRRVR